ncbi:hypothetical protein AVEN_114628-1 [Araneus ventricosus]|uniref:Uncharacterized protein n=1 Tax=Araneus ventricosus TaxID=182803 RepID=A0A4Y2GBB9_ARAVE|nr:hypothetical protein AVEN_114628-1 [Araneus ventricosus]
MRGGVVFSGRQSISCFEDFILVGEKFSKDGTCFCCRSFVGKDPCDQYVVPDEGANVQEERAAEDVVWDVILGVFSTSAIAVPEVELFQVVRAEAVIADYL